MEVQEQEKNPTFETVTGQELEIIKIENSSLFKLHPVKGGDIPTILRGMWTTARQAKNSIDEYNAIELNHARLKAEKKAEDEKAIADLIASEPTKENYVEHRLETLKHEKKQIGK